MLLSMLRRLRPFTALLLLHGAVVLLALAFIIGRKGPPHIDRDTIVVLPVHGVISQGQGGLDNVDVSALVEEINELRDKDHVKALVLDINSPGGSVGAVQAVYYALQKFTAKGKTVVSSFGDVSASGGYYIACAGQKIISQPGSLTGSIGVIFQLPNAQGLLNKVGVSMTVIKSGEMKDAGSPFRQMSEKERAYFQSVVADSYRQFYDAVKSGRKLEDAVLKPLADGRIFSGQMAKQNGLVDELGGLEEAIETAKKVSGLENKNPRIVHRREKASLQRLLRMTGRSPLKEVAELAPSQAKLLYLMTP